MNNIYENAKSKPSLTGISAYEIFADQAIGIDASASSNSRAGIWSTGADGESSPPMPGSSPL